MKRTALIAWCLSLVSAAPTGSTSLVDCSSLELVWARGTVESQSSYGIFVGDAYISQLRQGVPGMTFYNVKYPATFGNSSPEEGVADTLRHLNAQSKSCPNQKFILGGYSQGAVVMHRAAVKLDPSILNRIIATTTFGDGGQQATPQNPVFNSPVGPIPIWPKSFDGKNHFSCVSGDPTCTPNASPAGILSHISYMAGSYIPDTVKFVQQKWAAAKSIS